MDSEKKVLSFLKTLSRVLYDLMVITAGVIIAQIVFLNETGTSQKSFYLFLVLLFILISIGYRYLIKYIEKNLTEQDKSN